MGLARHGLWLVLLVLGCTTNEAQEQGTAGTPFCRKVRHCLTNALPKSYRLSMGGQVLAKAKGCLGHDARSVWTTRDCLPFEFARAESSGIGLQVMVDCSEVCPMNAGIMLRFTEPVGPFECECMGATARYEADWGQYLGCSPVAREVAASYGQVKKALAPDTGVVIAANRGPAPQALGLDSELAIVAVDDVEVRTEQQLEQVLARLPNELPGSIRKRTVRSQDPRRASEVVVHYPPQAVFMELSRLAQEIDFAHIGPTASYCAGNTSTHGRIEFAGRDVGFDRQCDNDATKRLTVLALAIQRAGSEAKPRKLSAPFLARAPEACRELRSSPSAAMLEEEGRAIELRYVDWLAR